MKVVWTYGRSSSDTARWLSAAPCMFSGWSGRPAEQKKVAGSTNSVILEFYEVKMERWNARWRLWTMSSALVCRCPGLHHSSPLLPRTWPKLMLDVSAFMKYWFQPLNSRHSRNGGIDDGAERDGLMQVLSLEQILVPCESKSHFSQCRVDLREDVSPLFPNAPVTWSTSPSAPCGT